MEGNGKTLDQEECSENCQNSFAERIKIEREAYFNLLYFKYRMRYLVEEIETIKKRLPKQWERQIDDLNSAIWNLEDAEGKLDCLINEGVVVE